MHGMPGRVVKWVGGLLTLLTAAGMGAYFLKVGLDKADKLAGVIGAFIALAGIALTVYGTVTAGAGRPAAPVQEPSGSSDADDVHNEIVGGTFYGPVGQGRNVVLGPQSAQASPPDEPPDEPSTTPQG